MADAASESEESPWEPDGEPSSESEDPDSDWEPTGTKKKAKKVCDCANLCLVSLIPHVVGDFD